MRKHGDADPSRLGARVAEGPAPDSSRAHDATVQSLSVRSLVLETSWAIQPGEHLRVDIVAPGMTRRLRLDGVAVRVAPKAGSPSRFDIEVAVEQELKRPIRVDSTMAMEAMRVDPAQLRQAEEVTQPGVLPPVESQDDVTHVLDELLSALILPPEDHSALRRRTHLSGELSRIRLPTLCTMFEMEKLTGRLTVQRGATETRAYFNGGRIVDVEPLVRGESRRVAIGRLLAAEDRVVRLRGRARAAARPHQDDDDHAAARHRARSRRGARQGFRKAAVIAFRPAAPPGSATQPGAVRRRRRRRARRPR